jgi:hypothetical protein
LTIEISRSFMPSRSRTFHQAFVLLDFLHYEYAPVWRFAPPAVANRIGRRFTQNLLILDGRADPIVFITD